MTETQERVKAYLEEECGDWEKDQSGWSYGQIAKALGLARSTVQGAVGSLRRGSGLMGETKARMVSSGNNITVTYDSPIPKPVERIIRDSVSNPSEWNIVRTTIRNRELKNGERIHGQTIYLEKVEPTPEILTITPLGCGVAHNDSTINADSEVKTAVIISDTHIGYERDLVSGELEPYTDRRAMDVAFQIIDDIEPDIVIHAGDVIDAAEVSRWEDSKTAEMFMTMQPSAVETTYLFDRLSTNVRDVVWIPGNHDIRWEKLLRKHAPALAALRGVTDGPRSSPVMSIASVCGLGSLGVHVENLYPDGKYWVNENLCIIHGTRASGTPGGTASSLLRDFQCSVIQGHKHTGEQVYTSNQGKRRHKTRSATVLHCLARLDGIIPGTTNDNNWTNGVHVVQYIEGDGEFIVNGVPIIRGKGIWNGKLYVGQDYAKDLEGYCGWRFPYLSGNYSE